MSGWSKSLYVLILIAVIVGIADYYNGSLGYWYYQNWGYLTAFVGFLFVAWFGAWFFLEIVIPVDEKMAKDRDLKKSIMRKKVLKEREDELSSLDLSPEEKEYQVDQWVKEAEDAEWREKVYGSTTYNEPQQIERVSPLSQREKEAMIGKVGTKCCYPNCTETIALEVHHITPRSEGGTNDEDNLIVLCNNHHHLADRKAIPKDRLRMYSVDMMSEDEYSEVT